MPEYPFESEEDLLRSERFQQWVRGEAPGDRHYWEAFLSSNPDKTHLYEKAVAMLLIMQGSHLETSGNSQKIQQIQEALSEEIIKERSSPVWPWLRWGIAAVLIIGILFWLTLKMPDQMIRRSSTAEALPASSETITRQNGKAGTMLVNLPDGSSVLLSKESSVRYDQNMNEKNRIVHLTGEGFFEVVKDPKRPFLVYADKVITRVLGTSFRVRSYPDSAEAFVAVKTGSVFVSAGPQHAGSPTSVRLQPNQQVNLLLENKKITATITEVIKPAEMIPVQKEPFEFQFTPVAEAFKVLEANYAVQIHFDEEKMRNCTITASLKDEPFLEKIRLICLATESSYQMLEDQIVIFGNGCQAP